jgi:hypothetical protein
MSGSSEDEYKAYKDGRYEDGWLSHLLHRWKRILNGLLIGFATCELLYYNNYPVCWFNPVGKNFLKIGTVEKLGHEDTFFHWGKWS